MGSRHRWWIGLLVLAGCHEYRIDDSRRPPPPPSGLPSTAVERAPAPPALPEYVVATDELRKRRELLPTASERDGGALVDGLRLSLDGRVVAREVAEPALSGGARVPAWLGGGFLFWSPKALYHAPTFLGRLEPVVALGGPVHDVSFGPDFALVLLDRGDRFALSMPARKPIPIPMLGLVDVAALADGRSIAVLEPGRVWITAAKGRPPSDVTARIGTLDELWRSGGEIGLTSARGSAFTLERDGSLGEFDRLPEAVQSARERALEDPRWTLKNESPLERAVRRGVPLDARTALCEAAGAVARVDLATGELRALSRRALPAEAQCTLVPIEGDVVAACKGQNVSFVTKGLRDGAEPSIDVSFASAGLFYAGGDGSLAFGGPCGAATTDEPSACVRNPSGVWKDVALRLPGREPDAGTRQASRLVRWIPRSDGTVLGLLAGDKPGLWDSARGSLEPFTRTDNQPALSELLQPPGSNRVLVDTLTVAEDGSIRGYLSRESIVLQRDGTVVRSPWLLSPLASAGPLAVGRSNDGRLWQSLDYGRAWTEVAGPPGVEAGRSAGPQLCSRVGCDFGRWLRLGFAPTPPQSSKRDLAPPAPRFGEPSRPELVCQASEPGRPRLAFRVTDRDGNVREELGFGASTVLEPSDRQLITVSGTYARTASSLLRAVTYIDPVVLDTGTPEAAQALGRPTSIRFYDPLAARSPVVDSRFSWRDVLSVAARSGQTDVAMLAGGDSAGALPVLASRAASLDGTLLLDPNGGVVLWARGGAPVRPLGLGPENEGYEPVSAAVRGKDELVVLLAGEACAARAVALAAAGSTVLFELGARQKQARCPSNPDALSVAADGSLGVVRTPSGPLPPTENDPALWLRPGQPPAALAPWATLRPGDAPECAGTDPAARALLMLPAAWIKLSAPGIAVGDDSESWSVALVRWSSTRVCLDAVELAAGSMTVPDGELPTAVVARFAAPTGAARRGYALGAELDQPLSCRLAPAP